MNLLLANDRKITYNEPIAANKKALEEFSHMMYEEGNCGYSYKIATNILHNRYYEDVYLRNLFINDQGNRLRRVDVDYVCDHIEMLLRLHPDKLKEMYPDFLLFANIVKYIGFKRETRREFDITQLREISERNKSMGISDSAGIILEKEVPIARAHTKLITLARNPAFDSIRLK